MLSDVNAGTILAKTRAGNEKFMVIEDIALVVTGGRRPFLENRYPASIVAYLNEPCELRVGVIWTDN